jgi:hypothetical protein
MSTRAGEEEAILSRHRLSQRRPLPFWLGARPLNPGWRAMTPSESSPAARMTAMISCGVLGCGSAKRSRWLRAIWTGSTDHRAARDDRGVNHRPKEDVMTGAEPGIELLPWGAIQVRHRKGGRRGEVGMDRWACRSSRKCASLQIAAGFTARAVPAPLASTTIRPRSHRPSAGPADSEALCCEAVGRGGSGVGSPVTYAGPRNPRVERIA